MSTRRFCEVAIWEAGEVRLAGQVKSQRAALELFAQSLDPTDRVAMEIARILEPHVAQVIVANAQELRAISHARVKSDRYDARTLAQLLHAGMLESVWIPDAPPRHCAAASPVAPHWFASAAGEEAAKHGRISKRGNAQARAVLVEAAWVAVRSQGPLRAFSERLRARKNSGVAAVAVARKIACLCWQLLTKEEDYAYGRPSLVRAKLRRAELSAGAPHRSKRHGGQRVSASAEEREAERVLVERAEAAYRRLVADWESSGKKGAGVTRGRASSDME